MPLITLIFAFSVSCHIFRRHYFHIISLFSAATFHFITSSMPFSLPAVDYATIISIPRYAIQYMMALFTLFAQPPLLLRQRLPLSMSLYATYYCCRVDAITLISRCLFRALPCRCCCRHAMPVAASAMLLRHAGVRCCAASQRRCHATCR